MSIYLAFNEKYSNEEICFEKIQKTTNLPVHIKYLVYQSAYGSNREIAPLILESRFGDKPVKFQVVYHRNGSAVLKGLIAPFLDDTTYTNTPLMRYSLLAQLSMRSQTLECQSVALF